MLRAKSFGLTRASIASYEEAALGTELEDFLGAKPSWKPKMEQELSRDLEEATERAEVEAARAASLENRLKKTSESLAKVRFANKRFRLILTCILVGLFYMMTTLPEFDTARALAINKVGDSHNPFSCCWFLAGLGSKVCSWAGTHFEMSVALLCVRLCVPCLRTVSAYRVFVNHPRTAHIYAHVRVSWVYAHTY
jgi:hypothetical protein